MARKNSWEGRVQVALRLNKDGRLDELRVVRSSGYAILDQDAVRTLQRIGTIPEARLWLAGKSYHTEFPVIYQLLDH